MATAQRGAASVATITYASTITPNAAVADTQRVTITANMAVAAPTNPVDNRRIIFEFTGSGTGPWTITLATGTGGFNFGTDITALPTLPTGTTMRVGVIYRASTGKWDVVAVASGY